MFDGLVKPFGVIKATNVKGSAVDNKKIWLREWEKYTNESLDRCCFFNCNNDSEVGGHLYLDNDIDGKHYYIAPICKTCNKSKNDQFYTMRQNITYLKMKINPKVHENNL